MSVDTHQGGTTVPAWLERLAPMDEVEVVSSLVEDEEGAKIRVSPVWRKVDREAHPRSVPPSVKVQCPLPPEANLRFFLTDEHELTDGYRVMGSAPFDGACWL